MLQVNWKKAIYATMSKRAVEALEEQLSFLGPKRLTEIESAQDRVIQIVRELEEDEEIILDTGAATLSFNKSIFFPSPPKSFEVKFHGQPLLDHEVVKEQNSSSYESGKKDATDVLLSGG